MVFKAFARSALDRADHHALFKVTHDEGVDNENRNRGKDDDSKIDGGRRDEVRRFRNVRDAGGEQNDLTQPYLNGPHIHIVEVDGGIEEVIPVAHSIEQRKGCNAGFDERQDDLVEDDEVIASVHFCRLKEFAGERHDVRADEDHVVGADQARQPQREVSVCEFESGDHQIGRDHAAGKEHGEDNVFDFTLGNPDLDPPQKVLNAIQEEAKDTSHGCHGYMPNAGYPFVREAIAKKITKEQGVKVEAGNVIMTVGAASALNCVFKALLNPGDEVIVPAPFFAEYRHYAKNHNGLLIEVPSKSDFSLDLEAIKSKLSEKTAAILINNPNNPSGKIYSADEIDRKSVV